MTGRAPRRGVAGGGILVSTLFLAVLGGYLLGSCPTSAPISRWLYGSDIRGHGSGNPGATNMLRTFGWRPALAVLALDAAKGYIPALLASWLVGGGAIPATTLGLAAGAAATLGHCYPLFAGFRGGKGVATAAGAFLATYPGAVAGGLAVFAALLRLSRYVSAASIGAAAAMPAILLAFRYPSDLAAPGADVCLAAALAGFIAFTHRSNLARMREGREPRVLRRGPGQARGGSVAAARGKLAAGRSVGVVRGGLLESRSVGAARRRRLERRPSARRPQGGGEGRATRRQSASAKEIERPGGGEGRATIGDGGRRRTTIGDGRGAAVDDDQATAGGGGRREDASPKAWAGESMTGGRT